MILKAMLVDDEKLALQDLQRQLERIGGITVVGVFLNPSEALRAAPALLPDVVFMDIDMPETSGIEAAEKLQNLLPRAEIVFVTAYQEYAVKAFDLNAIDYILKPLQRNRLAMTMDRLAERVTENMKKSGKKQAPAAPAMFRLFGSLQLEYDGSLTSIPWRTTKAQELFAYLLYRSGQPVRKDTLLELLWPDTDNKRALTQLYTTVYQVRKTMDQLPVSLQISNMDKGYVLELKGTRLDTVEWENAMARDSEPSASTIESHLRQLSLYRGDFLADCDYLWAETERYRLRTLWRRHTVEAATKLEQFGLDTSAFELYSRMLELYPYSEETYWSLMRLQHRMGDRSEVDRLYELLRRMTQEEYSSEPDDRIAEWYERTRVTC